MRQGEVFKYQSLYWAVIIGPTRHDLYAAVHVDKLIDGSFWVNCLRKMCFVKVEEVYARDLGHCDPPADMVTTYTRLCQA